MILVSVGCPVRLKTGQEKGGDIFWTALFGLKEDTNQAVITGNKKISFIQWAEKTGTGFVFPE